MLKIELPDLTNYRDTHEFINDNSYAYWEMVNSGEDNPELLKFKLTKIAKSYAKTTCIFDETFIDKLNNVKGISGIYLLWSGKNLVYIGKSLN